MDQETAILTIIKDDESLQNALIRVFKESRIEYDTVIKTLADPEKKLAQNFMQVNIEKFKSLVSQQDIGNNEEAQTELGALISDTLANDPILCLMMLQGIDVGQEQDGIATEETLILK